MIPLLKIYHWENAIFIEPAADNRHTGKSAGSFCCCLPVNLDLEFGRGGPPQPPTTLSSEISSGQPRIHGAGGYANMKSGQTAKPATNKPAHEIRIGLLRATIWKNDGEKGPHYNTTFERSYLDDKEWKTSNSFGRDDLLVISHLATECYRWITSQPPAVS